MPIPQISNTARNFSNIKEELRDFLRANYPNMFPRIEDASVMGIILDLLSGLGDSINYNIDYALAQTNIEQVTSRAALLDLARTLGVKVTQRSPSLTLVDVSITVPTKGDSFDEDYIGILLKGSQVNGGGGIFEFENNVDFLSDTNDDGVPNRTILPNFDANNSVTSYTITKQEIVRAGRTKIFKYIVSIQDIERDFFELVLPDSDILSIERVIQLDGINYTRKPKLSEWTDSSLNWYEVDTLIQDKVFKASKSGTISSGSYFDVNQRFIKEFTHNGFCKMIFGGADSSSFNLAIADSPIEEYLQNRVQKYPLGQRLKPNATLFVEYRVGGGSKSNVGINELNSFGVVNYITNTANNTLLDQVKSTLSVTNNYPSYGGRDLLSIEEIRNIIKYNTAAQGRAVTLEDYYAITSNMSSRYGGVFKLGVAEIDNKVTLAILGLNGQNQLVNESTDVLKENIKEYLCEYKMLNDYVNIVDGKIINIGIELDLLVSPTTNRIDITNGITQALNQCFNVKNRNMGQNTYVSDIIQLIKNNSDILNVIDIRFYNLFGKNKYSLNRISQTTDENGLIQLDENNALFLNWDEIAEIKFPSSDIKIRFRAI